MHKVLKYSISVAAGTVLGSAISKATSNRLTDVARKGVAFESKGLVFKKYRDIDSKRISKKKAEYRSIATMTPIEGREVINRYSGMIGGAAGIGGTLATMKLIDNRQNMVPLTSINPRLIEMDDEDDED